MFSFIVKTISWLQYLMAGKRSSPCMGEIMRLVKGMYTYAHAHCTSSLHVHKMEVHYYCMIQVLIDSLINSQIVYFMLTFWSLNVFFKSESVHGFGLIIISSKQTVNLQRTVPIIRTFGPSFDRGSISRDSRRLQREI